MISPIPGVLISIPLASYLFVVTPSDAVSMKISLLMWFTFVIFNSFAWDWWKSR